MRTRLIPYVPSSSAVSHRRSARDPSGCSARMRLTTSLCRLRVHLHHRHGTGVSARHLAYVVRDAAPEWRPPSRRTSAASQAYLARRLLPSGGWKSKNTPINGFVASAATFSRARMMSSVPRSKAFTAAQTTESYRGSANACPRGLGERCGARISAEQFRLWVVESVRPNPSSAASGDCECRELVMIRTRGPRRQRLT